MTCLFQVNNNNNNRKTDKGKFPFTSFIGEVSCPQNIWSEERRILPNVFVIKFENTRWQNEQRAGGFEDPSSAEGRGHLGRLVIGAIKSPLWHS